VLSSCVCLCLVDCWHIVCLEEMNVFSHCILLGSSCSLNKNWSTSKKREKQRSHTQRKSHNIIVIMPATSDRPVHKDAKGRTREERKKLIKRGPAQKPKLVKKQSWFAKRQQLKPKAPKEVTFETTLNLHSVLRNQASMKRKAPRAVRAIKDKVSRFLQTADIRIDTELNKYIWSNGMRNPPKKLRLIVERKPVETSEEESNKRQRYYGLVKHKLVSTFEGLGTVRVEASAEAQE
jgi:large subunit ribosomal protein L31e